MSKSEIHAGYEFEEGMFSRMRSWVDVASWVRLARIPRILASPSRVGLVAVAWILSKAFFSILFGRNLESRPLWNVGSLIEPMLGRLVSIGPWRGLMVVVLMVLLWTPVIQFVCRGGALLAAGRNLPGAGETIGLIRSRLWKSYCVSFVPWICVAVFAVAVFLIRLPSLLVDFQAVSVLTGWMIGFGAIPIGILGFGAFFSIPLGVAAMICEPDPDPIDSLSRGYEYLFRRPLSLIWYVAVSCAMVAVAGILLGGVGWVSTLVAMWIVSVVSPDSLQFDAAREVIGTFVIAWQITLSFGLLGGIYLLLRSDAGGQEAEDLWIPQPKSPDPLPELPKEVFDT